MPIVLTPSITTGYASGVEGEYLPSSGDPVVRGLECYLSYNGLTLGNTRVADRYRILSIEGLGDADIRDSRDENPSSHGETAFDAFYGGRTIVITGRIEAGNFGKLRDMQHAIRLAFTDLDEKQLNFLTANSEDNFFLRCRKIAPTLMEESQDSFNLRRNFQITLRASNPNFQSFIEYGEEFSLRKRNSFTSSLELAEFNFGIGSASTLGVTSNALYATTKTEHEFYQADEAIYYEDVQTTLKFVTGATVRGTGATIWNVGVSARRLDEGNMLMAEVFHPGGTATQANLRILKRDASTFTTLAAVSNWVPAPNTTYWLRGKADGNTLTGQLFATTTEPAETGGTPNFTVSHTLLGTDITKFGDDVYGPTGIRLYGINNDYRFDDFTIQAKMAHFSLSNHGSAPSLPRIRLEGAFASSAQVTNLLNDSLLLINDSIADGDFYEYNSERGTLVDSDGDSKFSELDASSSNVFEVDPDVNPFIVELGDYAKADSSISIAWRYFWI